MLKSRLTTEQKTWCNENRELAAQRSSAILRGEKATSAEECARINAELVDIYARCELTGCPLKPVYFRMETFWGVTRANPCSKEEADIWTEDATEDAASTEQEVADEESASPEEEVALRFGRLEKGGHRRVYLDEKAVAHAVGFELRSVRGTKRYCLGEEEYANATMSKLFKAFDGTYYDLIKKDFVSPSSKNALLDDFRAVFSSEVEAVKSTYSAEPEPGHDEEPVKEESTSTKEKYDPERHIRAAEVKAIFKTLLPHAPSSTRLCIWDITPGLSSGEVYRIGLSYTEEEMGLLARYSHPASTMAISRDVTSDSPYGGLAPVYNPVFDRDVVEGLVATWKASDPVYDRRAQEAARKERTEARREAQAIRETQDVQ